MKKSIVISVLGEDSPGLVELLSKYIVAYQGDWVESRMANLAGKFAGILRVNLPANQVDAFQIALNNADNLGLNILFEETSCLGLSANQNQYHIELIGQDQPGIVHKISTALADIQANVDDLHTEVVEASMSGENLFKANIKIHISSEVPSTRIRQLLESLANELIVDINLLEADA